MANSFVKYTGNGATTTYSVPFSYLDKTHVYVYINDVLTAAYTWPSSGQIQFTVAPANGATILIRRKTSTSPLVDFTARSRWQSADLDKAVNQTLYAAVEALEGSDDWFSGVGVPSNTLGDEGDFYINTFNQDYYLKGASTWTLVGSLKGTPGTDGINGIDGINGSVWSSGTGAPSVGLGVVGDWYLDTSTSDAYEKTGSSVWTLRINLKGAQGIQGLQGIPGTNGTNGADGASGGKWFSGTTVPAGGTGAVGDWYLRTSTGDVYEKTGVSTWTQRMNIIGPAGSGSGDMLKSAYDSNSDNKVNAADTADAAPWSGITGKPTTLSGYGITDAAPLASPGLTGNPTAPTQAATDDSTKLATTAMVQDAVKQIVANAQTGTSYTFVLTDEGKMVTGNNASAITWTIPPNSSVAFPVGTRIDLLQIGAGQIAVAPGSGVTLNSSGTKRKLTGQFSAATLWKQATDTWYLIGDIAT